MAEPKSPRLSQETLLRLGLELAGLPVARAGADKLLSLVNELQIEAAVVVRASPSGSSPRPLWR